MKTRILISLLFITVYLILLRTSTFAITLTLAPPTPTPTSTPTPMPDVPASLVNLPSSCYTKQFGDADCNGAVNSADFDIWKINLTNKNVPIVYSDFFPDGRISVIDFEIWRRYSNGLTIPSPTITPTPTAGPSPTIFCPYPIPRYCEFGMTYPPGTDQNGCPYPPICNTPTPGPSATPPAIPALPTPTGPNCCFQGQIDAGYQCVQNCPPPGPVNISATPQPLGYSCLSPSLFAIRQSQGCRAR